MKRALSLLMLAMVVATSTFLTSSVNAQTLAFPEAEGFGRYATGARTNLSSASIYHVTNLNNSGSGSFRDAVSQSNRFIVFDVGGIVNIDSVVTVASNITIAGQTAPGGISLYNDRISFTNSDNLISRHFAVRKGNPGVRTDTASIARGSNMIFDHMSFTWGVDGTFDINPDSGHVIDNISIQNSIIAQGLDRVGHSTGGLMTLGTENHLSIVKSIFADNVTRNPKVRGENEFINNVVYGWESAGYIMGDTSATSNANVEGNYFIEGPVDGSAPFSRGTSSFHIYANDNWVDTDRDGVLDGSLITSYSGADVVTTRHAFPTTATMTAQETVDYVMQHAGVSIIRDAVDTRISEEIASYGTLGGVILRDTDANAFPGYGTDPSYLSPRARLTDADNDGMLDNWERYRSLNPNDSTDWKVTSRGGYIWLERYINELGADGKEVTSTGGSWGNSSSWVGGVPTLADDANSIGSVTHASGYGFARRMNVAGTLDITGGSIDVFDTAVSNGVVAINGGTLSAGRVILATRGQTGALTVGAGSTLQTGTVATDGGNGLLVLDGGTFRAAASPDISVPTVLGVSGGIIDTAGYSGSISGPISGSGRFAKRGDGSLTLSGANSFTGGTTVEAGTVVATGTAILQSTAFEVAAAATLDVTAHSTQLTLGSGKSLTGMGTVVGTVTSNAGSVISPLGQVDTSTPTTLGIQAESLAIGSDWAIFNNATHGTGVGGSYDGSDLNSGGIVQIAGESTGAPSSNGLASTTIDIPESGTWYLYAKTAEPSNSGVVGDGSVTQGGNNSLWVSNSSSTLAATTSNYDAVQTLANPGDESTWTLVSPSFTPLTGVNSPADAGIEYALSSGLQTFAIYGREMGTVIDGFVLSQTNLTATELESVLNGATFPGSEQVLTIDGDYNHNAGSLFDVVVDGTNSLNKLLVTGTAALAGELAVSLADGFVPEANDTFEVLTAGNLTGQFSNIPSGSRVTVADGSGSFLVGYSSRSDKVYLSNFLANLLPGDFNDDGIVDAADYTVWRDNLGAADESAIGNNGDGLNGIDVADYQVWRDNYGSSLPTPSASYATATAVPEPTGLMLVLLGAMFPFAKRRTAEH